jgi:hypothetical protein
VTNDEPKQGQHCFPNPPYADASKAPDTCEQIDGTNKALSEKAT